MREVGQRSWSQSIGLNIIKIISIAQLLRTEITIIRELATLNTVKRQLKNVLEQKTFKIHFLLEDHGLPRVVNLMSLRENSSTSW